MLLTEIFNGGSEGYNLNLFLKESVTKFNSVIKFNYNSIKSRASQIHLLLDKQSDNGMFELKNCAETIKQIAHSDRDV